MPAAAPKKKKIIINQGLVSNKVSKINPIIVPTATAATNSVPNLKALPINEPLLSLSLSIDNDNDKRGSFMGSAFKLGTELVAAVAVGTIIGFILDTLFDTKPWLIIIFFFLGAPKKKKIIINQGLVSNKVSKINPIIVPTATAATNSVPNLKALPINEPLLSLSLSIDNDNDKRGSFMGSAFKLGTELVAAVAVGTIIGFILDTLFDTKPWLIIIFFFLGAAAGMLNVVRAANKMQKD